MKKTISSLILACAALCASAAPASAPSILELKHSISDNAIVYPESFETDTHKMLQNWYLQTYAVLDTVRVHPGKAPTDEQYVKLLAAMPTTIEMPYNQIVRSYINMYTTRKREMVEAMLGMSLYYLPIFEQALERHGVPLELRYLPVIESALDPNAVSRAGATGLWQFMLPTARGLGLEVNTLVDERRDPYASSEAAAVYLKQLYNMYGDWSLAIAAYNCGPGNVNKALRRAGMENKKDKDFWSIYYFLPAETRGYVPAFIAANYVMTNYKRHGIAPALARRPIVTDSVLVKKRVHFNQISKVLDIPVEEIRVLNPQYRHDVIPGDIHPYSLVLPSMQIYSYIMSEDSIVAHDAQLYARRTVVEPTSISEPEPGGEYTTKLVTKTHTVKRGETLSGIAKIYGVSSSDIMKWNGLRRKTLARGRKLKINTYQRVYVGPSKESAQADAAAQAEEEISSAAEAVEEVTEEATPAAKSAKGAKAKSEKPEVAAKPDKTEKPAKNAKTETTAKGKKGAKAEVADDVADAPEKVADKPAKGKKGVAKDSATEKPSKGKGKKGKTAKETTHTVKSGESLYRIAKAKGTTVEALKKANGIKGDGDDLKPGQKLTIPKK